MPWRPSRISLRATVAIMAVTAGRNRYWLPHRRHRRRLPGRQSSTWVHSSDADLADLYRAADVVISPSPTEGFGLPPVEAAACGTAVVARLRSVPRACARRRCPRRRRRRPRPRRCRARSPRRRPGSPNARTRCRLLGSPPALGKNRPGTTRISSTVWSHHDCSLRSRPRPPPPPSSPPWVMQTSSTCRSTAHPVTSFPRRLDDVSRSGSCKRLTCSSSAANSAVVVTSCSCPVVTKYLPSGTNVSNERRACGRKPNDGGDTLDACPSCAWSQLPAASQSTASLTTTTSTTSSLCGQADCG